MPSFSLDDIRAAADRQYGSTDIQVTEGKVTSLLNPLRMAKAKRDALYELLGQLQEDEGGDLDVDPEHIFTEAIRLVAADDRQAEVLLDAVGGDLAILKDIFEKYMGALKVGEASPSQD